MDFKLSKKIKKIQAEISEFSEFKKDVSGDFEITLENYRLLESELLKELKKTNKKIEYFKNELQFKNNRLALTVHDLKVPITISLLNLELAEMEEDKQEKENYIVGVRRELEFLLDTIGNLLEIEQLKETTSKSSIQEIDLKDIIDGVIGRMEVIIKDKPDLKLINEVDSTVSKIMGNRHKIIRLFNNLFSNAIKYTDQGHIKARTQKKGENIIQISVEDTGQGIEKDRIKNLFNLYMGDESRIESTGVGLSYVKSVVDSLGGTIWIESEKGVGTKVFMEIPI